MSTTKIDTRSTLRLRPGEHVRVRSAEEILRTLDDDGKLDGLPFMPEMLAYCGQILQVSMRADKTCNGLGTVRWMDDVVHLVGTRCDGSGHDGCQAACKIFWKEAWLARVRPDGAPSSLGPEASPRQDGLVTGRRLPVITREVDGETLYMCQATEVPDATRPLPPWEPQQYRVDLANWTVGKLGRNLLFTAVNKAQELSKRYLPPSLRWHGGARYPFVQGRLQKTPKETLGLVPGDVVRVKSRDEIVATLDANNRNRGLMFDGEMTSYCGRIGRVRDRIERIIDEHTGRMITIESDCVTLEGMVCKADYHRLCSREIYHYWREIWLEKVE